MNLRLRKIIYQINRTRQKKYNPQLLLSAKNDIYIEIDRQHSCCLLESSCLSVVRLFQGTKGAEILSKMLLIIKILQSQ